MEQVQTERRCLIAQAVLDVPEKYADALRDLVNRPYVEGGLTDDVTAREMRDAGLRASATSIRRHRKGTCGCTERQGD